MALGVMAGLWPLRPRSLHADFCAGERVMGVDGGSHSKSQISATASALWEFRGFQPQKVAGLWPLRPSPYTQTSAPVNALWELTGISQAQSHASIRITKSPYMQVSELKSALWEFLGIVQSKFHYTTETVPAPPKTPHHRATTDSR